MLESRNLMKNRLVDLLIHCVLLCCGLTMVLPMQALAASVNYPPYYRKLEQGLFYPAFLERDSALIAEQLGLSDDERVLVEAVINSYVETFEAEAAQVKEAIDALQSPELVELPDHVDRAAIRKRATEEMYSDRSGGGINGPIGSPSERYARTLGIITEELERMPIEDLSDSSRTALIADWSLRRKELEAKLLAELDLIKAENSGHWDAIQRALRRLNSDWGEHFRGEEADLDQLMQNHFGSDDLNYLNARSLLVEYAMAFDMQLAIRNAILEDTTPLLLDALDRTHLEQALSLSADQIRARADLVDVNLDWKQKLVDSVEDEQRRVLFEKYLHSQLFPDLHLGDPPTATINYLIGQRLDPETQQALIDIGDSYRAERDGWRSVAIVLRPSWEQDRLMEELEISVMNMVYKGWLNGVGKRRQSLVGWRNHLKAGIQLNRDYMNQIQALIGFEAMDQVPGRFRVSRRADQSRSPVPGAKRNPNVVYWDGLMSDAK